MSENEEYKEYEVAMDLLFREIKARDNDVYVKKLNVVHDDIRRLKYFLPALPAYAIDKARLYNIFIDMVKDKGIFDFNSELKNKMKCYYIKNKFHASTGEGHIMCGFEMPGDNEYVYNYDIISNVHYGVVALKAGFSAFEADKGAKLHDWSHGHDFFETFFGNNTDGNAVRLGMDKIYPLGKKLTLQNLKDTLFVFRNRLNRTRRDELIEASHDVRKGESLYSIAFQNGVDVKLVQQKNPEYAKYSAISPLPAGAKITLPTPKEIRNRIIAEREEKKHIKELMQSRAYHDKTDPDHTASV